jgi:hypothetical protein
MNADRLYANMYGQLDSLNKRYEKSRHNKLKPTWQDFVGLKF